MKRKDLALANEIIKEINELDEFIDTASKVWGGKLIIEEKVEKEKVWKWKTVNKASRLIFKSDSYGVFNSKEYVMNNGVRKKVLGMLIKYKLELEKKLEDM
ncbi:hypothetical protein UT300003_33050 [Clostridium sardiniense]